MSLELGYNYEDFTIDGFTILSCLFAEITILFEMDPEKYKYYYIIMYDNVFNKLSKHVIDAFNIAITINRELIIETIKSEEYNMSESLTNYIQHVINIIQIKTREGTY